MATVKFSKSQKTQQDKTKTLIVHVLMTVSATSKNKINIDMLYLKDLSLEMTSH